MPPSDVLPECTSAFSEIRLQIGLMEKDLSNNRQLIEKLTEGIEKIQEMNTNLVKMLALHEQKHETHEKIEDDIEEDIKELHSRITTESRAMQDRVDNMKRDIFVRLESFHSELVQHMVVPRQPQPVANTVEQKSELNLEVTKTLRELDKWKYLIMGGVFTLGWILAHIKWSIFLQLFGVE